MELIPDLETPVLDPIGVSKWINPHVSRTTIDIDDRLVAEVIRRYRLASKGEAVELALRRLVDAPRSRAQMLALEVNERRPALGRRSGYPPSSRCSIQ